MNVTPEEREWLEQLQRQVNANTEAITALGGTLKPISENIALANVLLTATGTLCAEIASGATDPHGRLEEILASFESSLIDAITEGGDRPELKDRVLRQHDLLRNLAERTLQARLG